MMFVRDSPPKERAKRRSKAESDLIKRREREFKHQQMWQGAQDYYQHWEKANSRYDQWTSPRYYEENTKMLSDLRNKQNKEELLQKRQEKLRKLLEEEKRSYEIEIMVKKNVHDKPPTPQPPVEVLKDINNEMKLKTEEKRRREAELKLYHQWRQNNPIVRQMESKYRLKDLKLTWLDQQIEKRIQQENEEAYNQRLVKDQEERLKQSKENEAILEQELIRKRHNLKAGLDQQIDELKSKEEISSQLKLKENEVINCQKKLMELENLAKNEERRRQNREIALFNIRQHKLKLKQKAADIQEDLLRDEEFILQMKKLQLEEHIEDEMKKNSFRTDMDAFMENIKQQREIEVQRQKHLDFLFESEVKSVYEKQLRIWNQEESSRRALLKSVLKDVEKQIEENVEKNKEKQRVLLKEREDMIKAIESYNEELQRLKIDEQKKEEERKQIIDEQVKLNKLKKKQQEGTKLKDIEQELERVRQEEERLQKEILEIQRRQKPCRPPTRRFLY